MARSTNPHSFAKLTPDFQQTIRTFLRRRGWPTDQGTISKHVRWQAYGQDGIKVIVSWNDADAYAAELAQSITFYVLTDMFGSPRALKLKEDDSHTTEGEE